MKIGDLAFWHTRSEVHVHYHYFNKREDDAIIYNGHNYEPLLKPRAEQDNLVMYVTSLFRENKQPLYVLIFSDEFVWNTKLNIRKLRKVMFDGATYIVDSYDLELVREA